MRSLLSFLLVGCATSGTDPAEDETPPCEYPATSEPMALGAPLPAYSWPEALNADGRRGPLDLLHAYCGDDPLIDWSPLDYLLFVSVPAW